MRINPVFEQATSRRKAAGDRSGARHGSTEDRRILVVDDEAEITASVAELLSPDHLVLQANSTPEALGLLQENDVSLVLTDQRMPDGSGVELLSRMVDLAPDVTRILFTGYSDISAVIEAVNSGRIYYYLVKPWQPDELRAVVGRGIERHHLLKENRRLVDELTRANEELEQRVKDRTARLRAQNDRLREARERIEVLSRTDALTGLANRGWLNEVLGAEIERCRRYGSKLSVIMMDLDHFKSVNDTYGHLVGDSVLRSSADTIRSKVRATDLAGRFGGEEFLLVLPNTGLDDACALAERLRVCLEETRPGFREAPVTGSFGVAQWEPDETVDGLTHRADEAMYAAKAAGRNRVVGSERREEEG